MQPTHLTQVYETGRRIREVAHLAHEGTHPLHGVAGLGRNRYTRAVDRLLLWIRKYVPALHWLGATAVALGLYLYALLVAATSRLNTVGVRTWPELPAPGVLAIWHGDAPSLLCAVKMKKPRVPLVIMISTEPRGDCLSILCRLLGIRVVRGSGAATGWEALAEIGAIVERGACAIITPDGGGPPHVVKPGVVVLAAAQGVPLVAVGASCSPALREHHKWDNARNPVPFGQIAVLLSEPRPVGSAEDAEAIERERLQLHEKLGRAAAAAAQAAGGRR
jgi:lysophospholipid acyltransferase (LPLAT)-like uncharacterized protein